MIKKSAIEMMEEIKEMVGDFDPEEFVEYYNSSFSTSFTVEEIEWEY